MEFEVFKNLHKLELLDDEQLLKVKGGDDDDDYGGGCPPDWDDWDDD